MATGRAPRAGRRCCATSSGAGWPRRWWRWATARWASGPRRARSGPPRASRPAGSISSSTCSTSCPHGYNRALHEMMYAERRADCETARARFAAEFQPKYAKAVESLTANWERLVTFFDFPAEHWKHLRTTNVIESPFATVRLRERATRGAGSRTKGLLMAFKLLEMVQLRWRHLDGAQLLPLVRAGVKFAEGVQVDPVKHVTRSTNNHPREAA